MQSLVSGGLRAGRLVANTATTSPSICSSQLAGLLWSCPNHFSVTGVSAALLLPVHGATNLQCATFETLASAVAAPSYHSKFTLPTKGDLQSQKSTERASKLEDTQILLSNRELFLHQNKDVYLKHYISPNQTLSHQNGADAALHTMSRDPPSPRDPSHACDIVHFSSAKDNCSSSNNEKKESDDKKPDLDSLAVELAYGITHIFLKSPNWKIYNPNLIFEDRIYSGKTHEGLLNYVKFLHLIKIVAHIKFVYVRCHVLYINKHPEDGTIGIRWKMTGLGITRLVIRYLPDKLWRRGNMDDAARVWYEGYSTFHVGDDNMIFKHVADTRMPDKFKEEMESALNPVVEKLRKLKPVVKQPVPTI